MEEIKNEAKKILLNAVEDLVLKCGMPYLELKLAEKNPRYLALYSVFSGPLKGLVDKIDGEVG